MCFMEPKSHMRGRESELHPRKRISFWCYPGSVLLWSGEHQEVMGVLWQQKAAVRFVLQKTPTLECKGFYGH